MIEIEAKEIVRKEKAYMDSHAGRAQSEAFQMAINALEKQIPKKPILKQYFDDMEEEYLCCPTCGEILTDRIPLDYKDFYLHCLNCGKKLNWESDEE